MEGALEMEEGWGEATVYLGKCWTGWATAGVLNPKKMFLFRHNYQFLCSLQPLIHWDVSPLSKMNTLRGAPACAAIPALGIYF